MAKEALSQQTQISTTARTQLDEIQTVLRTKKGKGRRETSAGRLTTEAIAMLHKKVCG